MFADPIGPPFPQVHLSVFFVCLFVCLFFLGGGEKGQQASSLSKHKLWNFHRYRLVHIIHATNVYQVTVKFWMLL